MKKIYITVSSILVLLGISIGLNNLMVSADTAVTTPVKQPVVTQAASPNSMVKEVNALKIVENPYNYLNQRVKITAKFDKFSTLGLDYPPAMRSHDNYISFLIQRPDVVDHNIPLSEMKIFLKKEVAEKHIDLNAGDEISFVGKVFSTALGDAWVDVEEFNVIKQTKKPADE